MSIPIGVRLCNLRKNYVNWRKLTAKAQQITYNHIAYPMLGIIYKFLKGKVK